MQAKRFFFEKEKQKTFIHCRRHGVRTENLVPSETDKSFLVLFCKKERLALLRFQWVDLPGQKQKKKQKTFIHWSHAGRPSGARLPPVRCLVVRVVARDSLPTTSMKLAKPSRTMIR